MPTQPSPPSAGARRIRRIKWAVLAGAAGIFAIAAAPLVLWVSHVYWDRSDLPSLDGFLRSELPSVGTIYDSEGKVLFELALENRRIVRSTGLPAVLRDAIVTAEDKNFFRHSGVDYGALPRVVWRNVVRRGTGKQPEGRIGGRGFSQGGSTITQQLVRGWFLRSLTERENGEELISKGIAPRLAAMALGTQRVNKLIRKTEEIRLSLWLEDELEQRLGSRQRAKEEILARYASLVYLGAGRYGFASAAEGYFGKPLSSFTAEDAGRAALLASIMKCPGDYAPTGDNLDRVKARRDKILTLMAQRGMIDEGLERRSLAEPIVIAARPVPEPPAAAAISAVFTELRSTGDASLAPRALAAGRIRVHATIDSATQRLAREALERGLLAYETRHPGGRGLVQGAVIVLANRDASVLAEVGGRQTFKGQSTSYVDFNRALSARRQPGSAMKPFVYLAALRMGASMDGEVMDEAISLPMGGGRPDKWIRNYDDAFKGPMPMRQALAESRNAATIWLARSIGIAPILDTAQRAGIHTPLAPFLSTALGAAEIPLVELANAYRTLASGFLAAPHVISRVTDSEGMQLFAPPAGGQPFDCDPEALAEIQEGLRGVVRIPEGTAHALDSLGIPIMGKTGTTNDFRDALFVGSTYGPDGVTVAVRIGYDDNRSLGGKETGARAALPIFKEIVQGIYRVRGGSPLFPREMEQRIGEYVACVTQGGAYHDPAQGTGTEMVARDPAEAGVITNEDLPLTDGIALACARRLHADTAAAVAAQGVPGPDRAHLVRVSSPSGAASALGPVLAVADRAAVETNVTLPH